MILHACRSACTISLLLGGLSALLVGPVVAVRGADLVATLTGRAQGRLRLEHGVLSLDRKEIPWPALLSFVRERHGRTPSPAAIHLRNGEIWYGRLLALKRSKLVVQLEPFGRHEIDTQLVESIRFSEDRADQKAPRVNTLYRRDGRPLTGRLSALTPQSMQITTPLGMFQMPHSDVQKYVFNAPDTSCKRRAADALHLVDGSVYRGALSLKESRVVLQHRILGTVSASLQTIHSLTHHSERVTQLLNRPFTITSSMDAMGNRPHPEPSTLVKPGSAGSGAVWELHLLADTALRFDLSDGRRQAGVFSAVVRSNGAGDSPGILMAACGGTILSRFRVVPDLKNPVWSFAVPDGQDLDLRFSFDEQVRYPCGVRLGDPVIIRP